MRSGVPTALTGAEEQRLVKYLLQRQQMGCGLTVDELCDEVGRLAENDPRLATAFKAGTPSRGFAQRFIARHPVLTLRSSSKMNIQSAALREKEVRNWFEQVCVQDGIY